MSLVSTMVSTFVPLCGLERLSLATTSATLKHKAMHPCLRIHPLWIELCAAWNMFPSAISMSLPRRDELRSCIISNEHVSARSLGMLARRCSCSLSLQTVCTYNIQNFGLDVVNILRDYWERIRSPTCAVVLTVMQ